MSAYVASISSNAMLEVQWYDQDQKKFIDVSYPPDFVAENWPPEALQTFDAILYPEGAKPKLAPATAQPAAETAPAQPPITLPGQEPIVSTAADKSEKTPVKK
jgi:hypothetical protein